jgi:hypothetical protein
MTFPGPSSLMLRRERRWATKVLLRRRCGAVCCTVRGVGSGSWSSRQVDVSPFAEVKEATVAEGVLDLGFAGEVDVVVFEGFIGQGGKAAR